MNKLNLQAPWQTFAKKLKALFAHDSDIEVSDIYRAEDKDGVQIIDVSVLNHEKFVALDRVLVKEKCFGNVRIVINLFDLENDKEDPGIAVFKAVFKDNPVVAEIVSKPDITGTDWNYVCFRPEIVQFFNDDLTDVNGNFTGLMAGIAKEVFEGNHRGVNFCTAAVVEGSASQAE